MEGVNIKSFRLKNNNFKELGRSWFEEEEKKEEEEKVVDILKPLDPKDPRLSEKYFLLDPNDDSESVRYNVHRDYLWELNKADREQREREKEEREQRERLQKEKLSKERTRKQNQKKKKRMALEKQFIVRT